MNSAISVRGLVKGFGSRTVLSGIDLEIPAGSLVGLLGTNGSGKTTLLKCLVGLFRAQAGQSFILGEESWDLSADVKARIGYVPQVAQLYPWMNVANFLRYAASFYPNWNDALAARLAREWDMPGDNQVVNNLSVGQLQKLSILTAMAHEPEVLILDEPAASLDPLARRKFLSHLIDLAEPGKRTVLFSSHILSDLEHVADRVAILKEGRLSYFGLLDELKEQTHLNLEDSFVEMHRA